VGYFTTLSQQMLTAIKHVADEKFLFSAGQHTGTPCMQRVKLQESERSSSLLLTTAFNLSAQQWSPLIMRFRGSHNSMSTSCKSELKKLSSDWLKFHEVATALEWKDAIFVFLFHSAETLFRWGGKINYCLVAYSLANELAKNYKNQTILTRVITKNVGDPFGTL